MQNKIIPYESNKRSRNWISTIYDEPLDEQFERLTGVATFAAGQIEQGNKTNHLHLQVFINFPQAQRLSYIRKLFPKSHHEIAGNPQKSIEYCTKIDTRVRGPFNYGINPLIRQKESFKLTVKDCIGKSEEELQELSPFYYVAIKKALAIIPGIPFSSDTLRGMWIHGPPGTGKSRKAFNDYPNAYRKAQNKWWDGYRFQKEVVLDDLDLAGGQTLSHYIKIWTDHYPHTGEVKGGHVQLVHQLFVVTSNYLPKDIWPDPLVEEAISRRFTFLEMK